MESGFYKNDDGKLLFAPNFVYHKDYELTRKKRLSGVKYASGWQWFDTRQEALDAYGITENTLYDVVTEALKEQGARYQVDPALKQFPAKQSDFDKVR